MRGVEYVFGECISGMAYDYSLRKLNEINFDLCGSNTVDLHSRTFFNSHFYDGFYTTTSGSEEIGRLNAEFFIKNYN